jgi:hypothetical protein
MYRNEIKKTLEYRDGIQEILFAEMIYNVMNVECMWEMSCTDLKELK